MDKDFELLYGDDFINALKGFIKYDLSGHRVHNDRFARQRAAFAPSDGASFYSFNDADYNNFDPSPVILVERAVSALMSYHLNPTDKFLVLEDIQAKFAKNVDLSKVKALDERGDLLHSIYQDPDNLFVQAQCTKDQLVFGFSTKTVEDDEDLIGRFVHYMPEETLLGSSNGRTFDIFGVKEMLTNFEAKQRFPGPITESLKEEWKDYQLSLIHISEPTRPY